MSIRFIKPVRAARTWTVDDDGPADFHTIQEAINAANPEDTIYVYNGTYYENLVVDKAVLLIGENKRNTIIDGTGMGTVVCVEADNVAITNFTIRNSGKGMDSGIRILSSNNTINTNTIINNNRGIWVSFSGNDLVDNTLINNTYSVLLDWSSGNSVTDNIVENNTYGVYLQDSSDNRIYHNSFVDNTNPPGFGGIEYVNIWDDGWPSGGNYWSDYIGNDTYHGPNQDQPGSDGIGDASYNITAINIDHYPRFLTVHNNDTGLDYCWIRKAIDADETQNGHTIIVDTSICYEHVNVYKSLTLRGENRTTTIIDGGDAPTVLHISASNVSISNFTIQNGYYGIHLDGSGDAVLRNNNMTNNQYNFFVSGTKLSHFINDVDDSNWVDGKRIYYLTSETTLVIDESTYPELGYLGLVNCTDVKVQNLNLTSNGQGLLLAFTKGSNITHVNASNNFHGIYLFSSSENTIATNNVTNNDEGICLHDSSANVLTDNDIMNSDFGIELLASSENTIGGNHITNSGIGICLDDSCGNDVTGNTVTSNDYGIALLWNSNSSKVADNTVTNNHFGIFIDHTSGNTLISNNVTNNKDKGIYLDHSSGNKLIGNNVMSNKLGISLLYSSGNNFTNNNIAGNRGKGINLRNSDRNHLVNNNITYNDCGIFIASGNDNIICHNNFINNIDRPAAVWPGYINTWDYGWPSGGNYWSNYACEDEKRGRKQDMPRSDGICDDKYEIPPDNVDSYPLTKPYGGQHDIGIKNVDLSKTVFNWTETEPYDLTIDITVINYGVHDETEINITAQAYNATHTILINSTTFNLELRDSTKIDFSWNTTGIAKGNYTITVNVTHVTGETYKKDNTYKCNITVSIKGDINGDGRVELKDLVLVIKHWGKTSSSPDWDEAANADINCDNKIEIKDLVLVIKYWGTIDP